MNHAKDRIVRPAYLLMCVALASLWLFFLGCPWLGLAFARCTDTGFAELPKWLSLPYLVLLSIQIGIEFVAVRAALVAFSISHGFKRLGWMCIDELPFSIWLSLMLCMSAASHADISTNSLFLATVWKSDECAGDVRNRSIEGMWSEIMSQSILSWVPGLASSSFSSLVFAAWALMLLQPVLALTMTVPLGSPKDYESVAESESDTMCESMGAYRTLLVPKQQHYTAIGVLADANRMMACEVVARKVGVDIDAYSPRDPAAWSNTMDRVAKRLLLIITIEGGLYINLQASYFAMERAASDHESGGNAFVGLSMALTVGMATMTLAVTGRFLHTTAAEVMEGVQFYKDYVEEESANLPEDFALEAFDAWRKDAHLSPKDFEATEYRAQRALLTFYISFVVYIVLASYALAKVLFAYVCEDAVWNITGCVDLA